MKDSSLPNFLISQAESDTFSSLGEFFHYISLATMEEIVLLKKVDVSP